VSRVLKNFLISWFISNPIASVIKVIDHTRRGGNLIANPIPFIIKNPIGRTEVTGRVVEIIRAIDPIIWAVIKIIWTIQPIVWGIVPVIDRLSYG
jgi:hypothetical protein